MRCRKFTMIYLFVSETDDGHTIEDTLKIVECSIQCLKMEMIENKLASISAFLKRQILGLHYIGDKLSLTSTRLLNNGRYSHVLLRSSVIPRTWHDRHNWMKVFELVAKMNVSCNEIIYMEQINENKYANRYLLYIDYSQGTRNFNTRINSRK
ncbi:hypothetical protein BDA99DRAFT_249611 [Phascolomyces articulosus]|uniref:Uncharacterized protein n=1 Tax=Phascolomyces articulosus TaxID=60185 RepID=A0AAD5PHY3_9FUNG|nr:hypothetical protein BDA99DRAFT_249611 [Phascolomyces articulosus]